MLWLSIDKLHLKLASKNCFRTWCADNIRGVCVCTGFLTETETDIVVRLSSSCWCESGRVADEMCWEHCCDFHVGRFAFVCVVFSVPTLCNNLHFLTSQPIKWWARMIWCHTQETTVNCFRVLELLKNTKTKISWKLVKTKSFLVVQAHVMLCLEPQVCEGWSTWVQLAG